MVDLSEFEGISPYTDAEAAEAAAKAAEAKAKLEARENEFYANVAKQAELLAEIRDAVKKQ